MPGFLERIEVHNFKSYRGTQVIGPFTWFTSIVGPNGSGKSNLMDAISFALGIQSSSLRSVQLKELIHTGATSAWVKAVYKTASGEEIHFKRSIGSGGAEYRINDRLVSAAAYNKAWARENVLVKARNFLVFQGDVEEVASKSPKDLTKLIEQISGSIELKAEYDELKERQERAIEINGLNLNRKRGVNAEKRQYENQQIENEQHAAKIAEKENLLKTLALWKLFHMEREVEKEEIVRMETEGTEEAAMKGVQKAEGALKKAKQLYTVETRRLVRLEASLLKLEKQRKELQPSLYKAKQEISRIKTKVSDLENSLAAIGKRHGVQSKEVETVQKELENARTKSEEFETWAANEMEKRGIALTDAQQALYNEANERAIRENHTIIQQVEDLTRQKRIEETRMRGPQEELEEARQTLRNLEKQREEMQARFDQIQATVERFQGERSEVAGMLEKKLETLEQKKQEEASIKQKLSSVLAKVFEAKSDRRDFEKQSRLKESISMLSRIFQGVHGTVSDVCKPTHKRYEMALSVVMGRNMDAVVVEKERTAIDCINYLKEQKIGQATFIPLDKIFVKAIDERYRSLDGGRLAIDCLEYSKRYERAVMYACGDAVICETLGVAKNLCYHQGYKVKAVSLEGTVIHKSGMITGGTVEEMHSRSRRWEEKEIQKLINTRDQLLQQSNDLKIALRQLDLEREPLERQVREIDHKISTQKQIQAKIAADQKRVDEKVKHGKSEVRVLQPQVEALGSKLEKLSKSLLSLEERLAEANRHIYEAFCRSIGVKAIKEYKDREHAQSRDIIERRTDMSARMAKFEHKLAHEERKRGKLEDAMNEMEDRIAHAKAEVQELAQGKLSELAKQDDELKAKHAEMKSQFNEMKTKVTRLQNSMNEAREEFRRVDREQSTVKQRLRQTAAKIERLHAERYYMLRKCRIENLDLAFTTENVDGVLEEDMMVVGRDQSRLAEMSRKIGIDYGKLDNAYREDPSPEAETKILTKLETVSEELTHLAPNLRVVERLNGVEKRLREVEQEFHQTRKAAHEARTRFEAVRKERTERFMEAFEHVSGRISEVYHELTMNQYGLGGSAALSLEDPLEPFTSGIIYHATPPGKRFHDLDHLSGGEKTVAALSLLFAIQSYHGSPFFILDEVDAALDSSNVASVAQYVRKLAVERKVQCLVVSLKSGFFEKAMVLVGVVRAGEERTSEVRRLDLESYDIPREVEQEHVNVSQAHLVQVAGSS